MTDNGRSQEAQQVRQESEFIKRIEDFARYMAPEYINDGDNPRSLCIIAGECIDAKTGKHAVANILLGDGRIGRCALRSMMEDNASFAAQVHELFDDDGANRTVEDLDEEIRRKQERQTVWIWYAVVIAAWSATIIALLVLGLANWITTASNLLLMACMAWLVFCGIKTLRADLVRLRQQRKRAAGLQKMMGRMAEFTEFLRQMRRQMEEDAGDDV